MRNRIFTQGLVVEMQYHYHLLECAVNDKVGILATLRGAQSFFFSKIAFGCNDTVAMKV